MEAILEFEGEHRFLSNFYPAVVEFDGQVYTSVEHAYQAAKTLDEADRTKIREAETAGIAKRLGAKVTLRSDWNEIRVPIMEDLLRQKYSDRNPVIKDFLVRTGDAELVEGNMWHDQTWGNCNCGKKSACKEPGQNMLGKLIMARRAQLTSEEKKTRILAVIGSRAYTDRGLIFRYLDLVKSSSPDMQLVSGAAKNGPDAYAEEWAKSRGVPIMLYPADWDKGKHAGMERNTLIVNHADVVLAFWDGQSSGTKDSIDKAFKRGKKVLLAVGSNPRVTEAKDMHDVLQRTATS